MRRLFFGNDEERLFLRLDFVRSDQLTLTVQFHRPVGYSLIADLVGSGALSYTLKKPDGEKVSRKSLARGEIVELAVPLADLGVALGSSISFQVRLSQDSIEKECCPEKMPIEFTLVTPEFALRNWIV